MAIRLLYFQEVTHKFQEHYRGTLATAYQQAGIDMPDFTKMNRREFLDHLENVRGALGGTQALDLLHRGLRELDKAVIPETWV